MASSSSTAPKMPVAQRLKFLREKMMDAKRDKDAREDKSNNNNEGDDKSKSASGPKELSTHVRRQRLDDDKKTDEKPTLEKPAEDKKKASPSPPPIDDYVLEKKVVRQIEYYFSDYNLPRDRFMLDLLNENFGWISMDTMLTFKRLSAISTDADFIMTAIVRSGSGLVQVDKERRRIRRDPKDTLPENSEARRLSLQERTVYVGGFARDGSVTLDALIDFFENEFEKVGNIRMRYLRKDDVQKDDSTAPPVFLGSCFVTFATHQAARDFLANKSELAYRDGTKLVAKSQKDFVSERTEYNDEYDEAIVDRTVWVHGFDKQDTEEDELADFFAAFAGAMTIRKRVFRARSEEAWKFTGAVFLTFEDRESAEHFMSLESVRRPNGDILAKKWQAEFFAERGKFGRRVRAGSEE